MKKSKKGERNCRPRWEILIVDAEDSDKSFYYSIYSKRPEKALQKIFRRFFTDYPDFGDFVIGYFKRTGPTEPDLSPFERQWGTYDLRLWSKEVRCWNSDALFYLPEHAVNYYLKKPKLLKAVRSVFKENPKAKFEMKFEMKFEPIL